MISEHKRISEHEKQEAWKALGMCVTLGEIRWLAPLSQKQKDCLLTGIGKKFNPGEIGRERRAIKRWDMLDFAFEILKGRQPDRSDRKTYDAVAAHYRCSWSLVRKARLEMRKRSLSFARLHKRNGFTSDDFAQRALPHINFDSFTDE